MYAVAVTLVGTDQSRGDTARCTLNNQIFHGRMKIFILRSTNFRMLQIADG